MSGEGFGKIKTKKPHGSKKPYERSTSFLGKLKNSVKDLLIPSWLISSSDTISNAAGESSSDFQVSPMTSQNGPECLTGNQSVPKQSDQNRPTELSTQSPIFPSHENCLADSGPVPNVNIAAIETQNATLQAQRQFTTSKLSVFQHKEASRSNVGSARLRMSDSYLTEASDSEPRAGPSQMMTTTMVSRKQSSLGATSVLWSSGDLRKGLSRPVKDKPAFNSSLLSSTSKPHEGFGESSFYSGKTCYGGSAAKRKKAINTSLPYQSALPLRKQVTATKLNSSLNATTSSTAQRILETLDKMSTPLGDAKKMPQDESLNDSIISFTPSSYRRSSSLNMLRPVTRPLQLPKQGPPSSQHQTLTQAVLAKNRNKVSGIDKRQKEDEDVLLVSESTSVVQDKLSSLPKEYTSTQQLSSAVSGKVKSKKFSQHMSNRRDEIEEMVPVVDLPTSFTLPITSINPMSFTPPPNMNTMSANSIPLRSRKDSSSSPIQFTFSTPIEERRPSTSNTSLNNSVQGFKFSTPIKASQSFVSAAGAVSGSKTTPEPAVGASSVMPAVNFSIPPPVWGSTAPRPKASSPNIGGTSSSFKSYNKFSGDCSSASDASSPEGCPIALASILKSGSVMDILGKSSSPVGAVPSKGTGDLMAKFKTKENAASEAQKPKVIYSGSESTNAASRLVAADETKSAASPPSQTAESSNTATKPVVTDDLMAKFRKPAGSWECDVCMLSNKPETIKCIACEAPKPGAAQPPQIADTSNNSLASMFKKPPGNWECDTCMVQNASNASRCIACDSPKPGLESAGTVLKKPESSTPAVQFAPGGGFVISAAASVTTTTTGSGGFKFGNSGSSSQSSTSLTASTGFVFGQCNKISVDSAPSATSTTSAISGGFKFGQTTVTTSGGEAGKGLSAGTSGFTFGNSNPSITPFPNFGAASSSASDKSSGPSVSSVIEVAPTSKSNFTSNGVSSVDNNNKSSAPLFVFGGAPAASTSSFSLSTNSGSTPSVSSATLPSSQPQINFSFSGPKPSSLISGAASDSNPVGTKPVSGLFQFGTTQVGASSSSTGLGMGSSVVSQKPLTNGGFDSLGSAGQTSVPQSVDATKSSGLEIGASASSFTLGQNAFSGAAGSSVGITSKRTFGSSESEEPSSKKAFNFGSSGGHTSINGGFHFGAAQTGGQTFGGSAAGASAPGGFVFGSAAKGPVTQGVGSAPGGGFQFGAGSSGFGGAAPEQATFKAPSINTANFNFGGIAQSSSAPFSFSAKPGEGGTAAPSLPFSGNPQIGNGPSFSSGPVASFNLGSGGGLDTSQRKMKRAVRRVTNRKP